MATTAELNNVNATNNNGINKTTKTDILNIDPRAIRVQEGFNVRREFDLAELKEQIRIAGVLNPITVITEKDKEGNTVYRLVDGERRYRAVMELIAEGEDIARIKAITLPRSVSEEDLLIQQMMKNEGKNFTEYECALMFQRFKDRGYNQAEIARKFGKSGAFVSRCLSLLDIAPELQSAIAEGEIGVASVRTIIKENKHDEKAQVEAVKKAVAVAKAQGKKTASLKDSKKAERAEVAKESDTDKVLREVAKSKTAMLSVKAMLESAKEGEPTYNNSAWLDTIEAILTQVRGLEASIKADTAEDTQLAQVG